MRVSVLLALTSLFVGCKDDGAKPGDSSGPTGEDVVDADNDGATESADCDDNNPKIYPGAEELPYNGIDDDCDPATPDDDLDGDGVMLAEDCDDTDASLGAPQAETCDGTDEDCDGEIDEDTGSTWYLDVDGDGYGDPAVVTVACEAPAGMVADNNDCDDSRDDFSPAAPEVCDEADNDCDLEVDEGVTTTYYADVDGDGQGDGAQPIEACVTPTGYAESGEDCDDGDSGVYPGAVERCDGVDQDCDGDTDEGASDAPIWTPDADGDGYGDDLGALAACEVPAGYVAIGGDCDDADPALHPDTIWYIDVDSDGWGSVSYTLTQCEAPAGYAASDGDCDDSSGVVYPGAFEHCDGLDNDCDGVIDGREPTWYADQDGDGYGDDAVSVTSCSAPAGYVEDGGDCDDSDASLNPDTAWYADNDADGWGDTDRVVFDCIAPVGYVGEGGDCDDRDPALSPEILVYTDLDGDGYGDNSSGVSACDSSGVGVSLAGDCDDTTVDVSPAAPETCDTLDNNCDGVIDEDTAIDAGTWYTDADSDTHGDPGSAVLTCDQPAGTSTTADDCDDTNAAIAPSAAERCNGLDDDCDLVVDEDDAVDASVWYSDVDGDGYGAGAPILACDAPSGTADNADDCDDNNAGISPDASESWYDGIDADCDLADDYDADGDSELPYAWGGLDCDDLDPLRVQCRETVSCTHPSADTLTLYDPPGASDIQFNRSCDAVISTLISGTDYIYTVNSLGDQTIYTGESNYDIGAIALDPLSDTIAVGYNNVGYFGVSSGSTLPVVATAGTVTGSAWSNYYLNFAPASLAMDSDGCVWWPNWVTSGQLACLTSSGGVTLVANAGAYIESVALDSAENLYIAVGSSVYAVDTSSGTLTPSHSSGATVLDMVFDYNDDLYLEAGGQIQRYAADGSVSVFATVAGQGRLAISPDGALVRIRPDPVSAASWEEWALP